MESHLNYLSETQLADIKSIGLSLASDLIFKIMGQALAGKEPSFLELVERSMSDAKVTFLEQTPDIEIDDKHFKGLLNDLGEQIISPSMKDHSLDLIKLICDELLIRELLYHSNEVTMRSYCESYAGIFCFILHEKILGSKYRSLLEANHLLSSRAAAIETKSSLEKIINDNVDRKDSIDQIGKKIDILLERDGGISGNYRGKILTDSDVMIEIDDKKIAESINRLEHLKKSKQYIEGIKEAKRLILEIPKSNFPVYTKVLNILLSLHLQGGPEDYEKGVEIYSNLDQSFKGAYSKVICSGLLNNLKQWGEGLRLINSIGESDILSFSKGQKDVFYQIKSLIQFHLGPISDAMETLEKMEDKQEDEYKYLLLLFNSKEKDKDHLDVAKNFLERSEDFRLVSGAINHILDRFNILQSETGNPFVATEKLQTYLELILKKVPKLLEKTNEYDDFFNSVLIGLICVMQLLGRHEDARKYISLGKRIGLKDFIFLNNSSYCMFSMKDYDETYELLERADLSDLITTNAYDMFLYSIKQIGKIEKFDELLESLNSLGLSDSKTARLKSTIYQLKLSKDDYLAIAKSNYEKFDGADWSCYDYAEALLELKKVDEAEAPYLQALEVSKVKLIVHAKLAKYYASDRKDYGRAVSYYQKIISKFSPISESVEYLHCLNLLNQYPKMIQVVDEIDPSEEKPRVQLYKGYALWQLGQIDLALKIIKPISRLFPEDPTIMQNYASLSLAKGNIKEVVWGLERLVAADPDNADAHMRYSQALMATGDFKMAVKEASLAVRCNFSKDLIHFNFINVHLAASKHLPNDPDINSPEMNELHTDLIQNFNDRFPQSQLLQPQVINYDENGQLDLSELKYNLEAMEERNSQVLDYYWEQKFPIAFISQTLNRNLHEIWSNLISSGYKKGLFVGGSNVQWLEEEIAISQGDGKKYIVDPITLISLHSQRKLELLKEIDEIYVGSGTVAEFSEIYLRIVNMGDGYLTIGVQNGQMVKEEITATQLANAKDFIKSILDFCNNDLKVISAPLNFNLKTSKKLVDVFDPLYLEIMYFCENGYVGILGDWNLTSFLKSYGIKNTSMQAFLVALNQKGKIGKEEYSSLISEWLLSNYRGLIYSSTDIGTYLNSDAEINRKLFLLDRVFYGRDFGTETNRMSFCAEVFADFPLVFQKSEKLLDKISEFLNSKAVSDQNKLFFILVIFNRTLEINESLTVVEELFPKLKLVESSGQLITLKDAKEIVGQAHKRELEMRQKKYEEKLGLD